ncbi:MAG: hypothetical protein JJU29_06600 [Verrucomicrobia bacterium]|nr:hypothetical protein [Verrucomicrobiota bacterium]MCH8510334.1 hypothetical protein [Kiritimatiellia bacterium]
MILALIKLESPKAQRAFEDVHQTLEERYRPLLAHDLQEMSPLCWATTVKPLHAGMVSYLVFDFMIHLRQTPCQFIFSNDLMDFRMQQEPLDKSQGLIDELLTSIGPAPQKESRISFRGFGPRIDICLNALGLLYLDILQSLTKVESEVLSSLRKLQYGKYKNPMESKTFGLQKHVASELGKSPVAIHKSLRSAKYELAASTARSMSEIIG